MQGARRDIRGECSAGSLNRIQAVGGVGQAKAAIWAWFRQHYVCTQQTASENLITTLHLTCGLPCAGKTTRACEIERATGALRLTPDEWLVRLLPESYTWEQLVAARDPIEAVLWDLTAQLLARGVDVILDFGLWTRAEREDFRARAAALGARSELHFLDATEDVLVARLAARNADLPPGTFHIDEWRLRSWIPLFEPPSPDELIPREV